MNKKNTEDVFVEQVAGSFYPRNNFILKNDLQSYFKKTEVPYNNEDIRALIVPHAGYIYSGETAMHAYKALYYDLLLRTDNDYKVILLAPAHKEYFEGIRVLSMPYYRTPIGDVKIYISENLEEHVDDRVFLREHAIEVQLPFIEYIFSKANKRYSVLPILVGDMNEKKLKEIAQKLGREINSKTIIIVSSDLSHFLEESQAIEKDRQTINHILSKDLEKENLDACGKNPIMVVNEIFNAKEPEIKIKEIKYTNSGEVADKSSVVGYVSMTYYYERSQDILLRLARKSIYNELHSEKDVFGDLKDIVPKEYLNKQGTFVTLTKNKQLRGCIGNIIATDIIFNSIISNAKSSAFKDTRFSSLGKTEFNDIHIEISILSEPKECTLEEIKEGDGVIIQKGYRSAVYLPQVWEQLKDKDEFLGSLCEKAGLDYNCYKEDDISFKKYSVRIIEE